MYPRPKSIYNQIHQPEEGGEAIDRRRPDSSDTVRDGSRSVAAASDLRWGRIYNFLTLPTLAAGLLLLMMNTPEELPPMLGVIAATLLLLFPFWKAGGLGAGDIKLLMALAPFMGPGWFLFGTVLSFLIGAGISFC